ncbi:Cathepsin_L [Hexamita inflata]|uniref:Cathepsin L n=1 Tax=Hexamita inflata TaxID=28002 RepID=A0AA86UPT9_9EUKA|nr:Cathepsin L [Hexamita inflata]CAI9959952.1 Cathepsin L [Hexamita inflata]
MFTIITYSLQLNCNITQDEGCDISYAKFANCYNKQISQDSKLQFCESLKQLLSIIQTCDTCDVTSTMDQVLNTGGLINLPTRKSAGNAITDCKNKLACNRINPLETVSQIYESVDLKEAGLVTTPRAQGNCGSCWHLEQQPLLKILCYMTNRIILELYGNKITMIYLSCIW